MSKEELKAYWNYSRIIRTIPSKVFETDVQAQEFLKVYEALETKYFKLIKEINS